MLMWYWYMAIYCITSHCFTIDTRYWKLGDWISTVIQSWGNGLNSFCWDWDRIAIPIQYPKDMGHVFIGDWIKISPNNRYWDQISLCNLSSPINWDQIRHWFNSNTWYWGLFQSDPQCIPIQVLVLGCLGYA
jgi:hypothetical protein